MYLRCNAATAVFTTHSVAVAKQTAEDFFCGRVKQIDDDEVEEVGVVLESSTTAQW